MKSLSKEELIDKTWFEEGFSYDSVGEIMDIYAKKEAIDFKKWCDENEGPLGYGHGISQTTEELYNFWKTPTT